MAVDDLGHTLALQLGVKAVEALVQPFGVSVADGEDDRLVRQPANIFAALVHELPHHGVVGALVDDALFDVAAIEVEFIDAPRPGRAPFA